MHWRGDDWTLDRMRRGADDFAMQLRAAGVQDGQPVAALVTSGPTALAQMFGTWMLGSPYLPLNARLSDRDLAKLVEATPPAVLVQAAGRDHLDTGACGHIVQTDELCWEPRTAATSSHASFPSDVAVVLRTSGTTGDPKPVLHTHSSMLDSIDVVVGSIRDRSSAKGSTSSSSPPPNLIPVSLALTAGVWNTLFALRVGTSVVLLDRFTSHELVSAVTSFEIRSTVLAPAMMTMLADDPSIDSLGPLRFIRSITAPLLPDEARRFHEKFGVAVLNSYGQTELGGEVAGWTAQEWRNHRDDKLGSAGRVHPGVDVRITDASTEKILGTGETGEIYIRSPFLTDASDANGALAGRLRDGYVRTGDLGHLDEDGFLWIDGRESDMINRGGLKLLPGEVEAVLREHPTVRDVCVAGVPDRRLGEVPYAWVIPDASGLDAAVLSTWCRERLSAYKVPADFLIVDELPRSEIGKVLRRQLVDDLDRPR